MAIVCVLLERFELAVAGFGTARRGSDRVAPSLPGTEDESAAVAAWMTAFESSAIPGSRLTRRTNRAGLHAAANSH